MSRASPSKYKILKTLKKINPLLRDNPAPLLLNHVAKYLIKISCNESLNCNKCSTCNLKYYLNRLPSAPIKQKIQNIIVKVIREAI